MSPEPAFPMHKVINASPSKGSRPSFGAAALPHAAIQRQLVLLPLYVTGILLSVQLLGLLSPPGERDSVGLVKGHDFVQFYALAHASAAGRLDLLYDSPRLNALMWDLVPASRGDVLPPFYGPYVALFCTPLSRFSYLGALSIWLCISAALYAVAAAWCARMTKEPVVSRRLLWALLLLAPALNVLLVAGQNSAVMLLALSAMWWALDRRRRLLAGAFLGVVAFKPQLAVGALAVLVLAREWRVVAGAAMTVSAQLLLGWAWAGSAVMRAYVAALSGPVRNVGVPERLPEQVHGWVAAFRLLLGLGPVATGLYVVFAVLTVIAAALAWRKQGSGAARTAILIVTAVLVCPHLYVYDLVVLTPVLAICCDRAVFRDIKPARVAAILAWLAWFVPVTGPIALATRIQFSTFVFVGILGLLLLSPIVRDEGQRA